MADYTPITNLRGPAARITAFTAKSVPAASPAVARMTGPDQNRQIEVDVPRGLPGVNALDNDAAVATYLAAPDSNSRQAADKLFKRDISPYSFGAIGNGTTDDTAAVIAAAAAARDAGVTLYIPFGTFRLTARVDVFGDIRCDGRFVAAENSAGSIRLARASTPTILTPSSLTGLTAGSTQIGGLGGSLGTIVLTSTERLINRDSAANPYYTKTETVAVVDSNGTVSPPIESTYDLAQVSVTFHPVDASTTASKITFTVDGAVAGTSDNRVSVYRSNVTLEDPTVINSTVHAATSAIRIQDAATISVIRPIITGFTRDGAGYGIAAYNTVDINVFDANITRCRHALSGRHTKKITAVRGTYEGGIDNHWNLGLILDGVSSIARSGGTHIAIAGRDVIARGNCNFYGGRNVVGIRLDTPELGGELTIVDCTWWPEASAQPWMVGYSSLSRTLFDFGRTVLSPDVTRLQRIKINNMAPWDMRLINIGGNLLFNRKYWRKVIIDDVEVINPGALWAYVDSKTNLYHPGETVASDVLVRNVKFPNVASSFAVYIGDTEDAAGGGKFNVRIEKCDGVRVSWPEMAMGVVAMEGGELLQWIRSSTSAQLPATAGTVAPGDYSLTGVNVAGTVFNGRTEIDFRLCRMSGAIASTTLAINDRVKSYDNNRHAVGVTGAPTRANGYRNPAYYSA